MGRTSLRTANLSLGLVPEGRQIFPNLSLMENLIATASNHQGLGRAVDRVFALCPELEARVDGQPDVGEKQQMLAIGRALMTKNY